MSFADLKFSRKLLIAFSVVVLAVAGMSGSLLWICGVLTKTNDANNQSYALVISVREAQLAVAEQASNVRKFAITHSKAQLAKYDKYGQMFDQKIVEARTHAAGHPDLLASVDELGAAEEVWRQQRAAPEIKLASDQTTYAQAYAMISDPADLTAMDAFRGAAETVFTKANSWSDVEAKNNDAAVRFVVEAVVGGGLAVLVISLFMGWLLNSGTAKPVGLMTQAMLRLSQGDNAVDIPAVGRKDEVGQMAGAVVSFKEAALAKARLESEAEAARTDADRQRGLTEAERRRAEEEQAMVVDALAASLTRLSDGDLTVRIDAAFVGRYAKLREDFNSAVARLQDTISTIASTAGSVRAGSEEISQASDDLSRRTEQQAASLEETAAALDEITATVRRTAGGATEASNAVDSATIQARRSGEIVGQAVAAMSEIEQSSSQISQIIGVIDEIAFQTNLLALNAGVEAARAGEAGRGFAVVAQEVRALAQRSAEAAKEIKTLISNSTGQVRSGVSLVGQTGEALREIVGKVAEISGVINEIAASAQEQATGLAQVNTAINQMDQVVQQNAAMVEQATAATHSLKKEALELGALVGRFNVGSTAREAQTSSTYRLGVAPTRLAGLAGLAR